MPTTTIDVIVATFLVWKLSSPDQELYFHRDCVEADNPLVRLYVVSRPKFQEVDSMHLSKKLIPIALLFVAIPAYGQGIA